jgi:hypothetical protein
MNTGTRRFLLRLAVGLLAFLLGVTAAWALGGFNPFQESRSSRYRYYNSSGSLGETREPAVVYPVYRYHGHGCRMRERLGELPPPPPPAPSADAPMPPSPPQSLR